MSDRQRTFRGGRFTLDDATVALYSPGNATKTVWAFPTHKEARSLYYELTQSADALDRTVEHLWSAAGCDTCRWRVAFNLYFTLVSIATEWRCSGGDAGVSHQAILQTMSSGDDRPLHWRKSKPGEPFKEGTPVITTRGPVPICVCGLNLGHEGDCYL